MHDYVCSGICHQRFGLKTLNLRHIQTCLEVLWPLNLVVCLTRSIYWCTKGYICGCIWRVNIAGHICISERQSNLAWGATQNTAPMVFKINDSFMLNECYSKLSKELSALVSFCVKWPPVIPQLLSGFFTANLSYGGPLSLNFRNRLSLNSHTLLITAATTP